MLLINSPRTVHRVGHKVRIPMEACVPSSSLLDFIQLNAAFRLGENLTNFVISKATSKASLHNLDCLMVSATARFSA